MYYLRPVHNQMFGRPVPRPYPRPLVLLWGDHHEDDSGMCSPCSCEEEKGNCCYTIYDKAFLKELDQLAADYPVDFYTESRPSMADPTDTSTDSPDNQKNILFQRFLRNTTLPCHDKSLRSQKAYETACPTKHIRWHYSDPRFMENLVEHYMFNPLETMFIHARMSHTWDAIRQSPTPHQLLYNALYTFHQTVHPAPSVNPSLPSLGGSLYQSIHQRLLSDAPFHKRIASVFSTYVDAVFHNPHSLFKQYRGIKDSPFWGIPKKEIAAFLTSEFLTHYSSNLLPYETHFQNLSPHARTYLRYALMWPTLPHTFVWPHDKQTYSLVNMPLDEIHQIVDVLESLEGYCFYLSAFFVELYMLFRMLKSPKDNSPPYLSMGFFGHVHTKNLADMLQRFGYEPVYSSTIQLLPMNYRCLTIDQPLLLTQDLEEHARALRALGSALQPYHNVLKDEQWSRNTEEFRAMENPLEGGQIRRGRKGKARVRTKTKKRRTQRRRRSTTR